MYQATSKLDEVNFDILEYAYLTVRTHHTSNSFDLWIPKFMAPQPFGSKSTWVGTIKNLLENDGACKVSLGSTIKLQNFVNVARHTDTDFSMRADIYGYLHVGQQFLITAVNHDPRDIKILKVM